MLIITNFTNNGIPATGLSPIINIINAVTKAVIVNDAQMEEIGNGFYKYDFTDYNSVIDYVIQCDGGASLPDNERYSFGTNTFNDVALEVTSQNIKADTSGLIEHRQISGENRERIIELQIQVDDTQGQINSMREEIEGIQGQLGEAQGQITEVEDKVTDINELTLTIVQQILKILKVQEGRWKIENNELIIYEEDGVTVYKKFRLLDQYGKPAMENIVERQPI